MPQGFVETESNLVCIFRGYNMKLSGSNGEKKRKTKFPFEK